jgi:glycosyltransferase involved in cell wall biosynthesis
MKAFGWAADKAGCYFYRLEQPLEALASEYGWTTEHGMKFPGFPVGRMPPNDSRLPGIAQEAAKELDVVIAQRCANLGPSVFLQLLQVAGAFTVYEIDDDLFNIDFRSNNSGWQFYGKPEVRTNIRDNIAGAARVTVSTPKLAEVLSHINPNIYVCPNAIPDWLLDVEVPRREGRVTIGWGGSSTHAMDFEECGSQLRQLFGWRDDIEFHTVGANYARWMKLPADRVRSSPWFSSVPEYYKAIDFDIGVAPLRPHIFNQSKSYIKALEYAALGIPVVASDVGPYRDFVMHGETGFLVRREHEWSRYLRALIEDPAMRAEMGAKARKLAAGYTTQALLPNWVRAFTEDR